MQGRGGYGGGGGLRGKLVAWARRSRLHILEEASSKGTASPIHRKLCGEPTEVCLFPKESGELQKS